MARHLPAGGRRWRLRQPQQSQPGQGARRPRPGLPQETRPQDRGHGQEPLGRTASSGTSAPASRPTGEATWSGPAGVAAAAVEVACPSIRRARGGRAARGVIDRLHVQDLLGVGHGPGLAVPPSVHDFVPAGRPAHLVVTWCAPSWTWRRSSAYEREERGRPPYLRGDDGGVLLYAYAQGVYASRRIAKGAKSAST